VKALILYHDEQIAQLTELLQGGNAALAVNDGTGAPDPKRQKRKRND